VAVDILLFLAGLALAGLTLADVFETVVVPGGSHAALRVAHRLRVLLLPLWKSLPGRRRGISGTFGPMILVGSFIIWMSFLALGFGLMTFAVRKDLSPPLHTFGDAIYFAGSALVTVGLSASHPFGMARWVVLSAGFCGLGVMTMAVTYLLEVQSSIARRDTGIIKLNTSAGEPPSALTLLQRFAAIRNQPEVLDVVREGRNWCATVRQSHAAHPSLVYFQSVGIGAGWPAGLAALMDLGLLAEHCIDDDTLYGPAVLLQAEGARMAKELALLMGLSLSEVEVSESELAEAATGLREAGYRIRADADFAAMAEKRSRYLSPIDALADHLGKPTAVLVRR
jgi:hypothetical protein